MSSNEKTTLPLKNFRQKVFSATNANMEPLPLGGLEANKFELSFDNPRFDEKRKNPTDPRITLLAKEYHVSKLDKLENLTQRYQQLYKLGLPVPGTARIFERKQKLVLAMTDMTEGGKYLIWGFNDSPSQQERETLQSMNLGPDQIRLIENKVNQLAERAGTLHVLTLHHYFHIRKERNGEGLNIALLDVAPESTLFTDTDCTQQNMQEANRFIRNLQERNSGEGWKTQRARRESNSSRYLKPRSGF